MSAPNGTADALYEQIGTLLVRTRRQPKDHRLLSLKNWQQLHSFCDQADALPADAHPLLRQLLVRTACIFAADALVHNHQDNIRRMFDVLQHQEKNATGVEPAAKTQLYIFLALVAHSVGKVDIADASSNQAVAHLKWWRPSPLVKASVLLVRGEVAYKYDQRKLLVQALKFMQNIKNFRARTDGLLELQYRTRARLCRAHCLMGKHLARRWQSRQARLLDEELRLGRGFTHAKLERMLQRKVVPALLDFED